MGYWNKSNSRRIEDWVGVVTPKDCPKDVIYPKEQALIDICKKQQADGKQTWVYVNMTSKRDILPRLKALLEAEGLKTNILRSTTCDAIDREDWIKANGRGWDVMLSHPELVATGLDLFSKDQGGHNYSTIVFYETGYNLFTMRQAARRAWRIAQPYDCRVYYLYYRETMQHKAMSIMSRKMAAAAALEGDFSGEGLAALAGDDNLQMALAKTMSEAIDKRDVQRNWVKVTSKKKTSRVDQLPPEAQAEVNASVVTEMIADALTEKKPIPAAASAEFPGILEMLAKVDAAFKAQTADVVLPEEEEYEEVEPEDEELDEPFEDWQPQPAPQLSATVALKTRPKPEPATIPIPVHVPLPGQGSLPFEDEPEEERRQHPAPRSSWSQRSRWRPRKRPRPTSPSTTTRTGASRRPSS